jgi:hypothetical protein
MTPDAERKPVFPVNPLPNVRKFKVKALSQHHPVFAAEKILIRQFPPQTESTPYTNKHMNKYLKHQFRRLNKYAKEGN